MGEKEAGRPGGEEGRIGGYEAMRL